MVVDPPAPLIDGNSDQADWPSYGHDLWNTRHNPVEPDHTSVRLPRILWRVDLGGDITGTPAVVGSVVYAGAGNGQVAALHATSGAVIWSVNIGSEVISGSVAVSSGRVFVPTLSGHLWALDQATGAVLWQADLTFGMTDVRLYGSPVVSGGTLYIGVASGQDETKSTSPDFHGSVVALDPATGVIRWTRFLSAGAEYGAGVWSTPAIDSGRMFVGSGNPYAEPITPYGDAMISLDASSGSIRWYKQWWSNDSFGVLHPLTGPDYDFGASPNLFWVNGRLFMGEGEKSGDYRVQDAADGTVLWSQHYINGALIGGFLGSTAYANGRIHAAVNNLISQADPRLPMIPEAGNYLSLSASSGAVLYAAMGLPTFSAPCVAGGVVYYSDLAGTIWARRADNGAILWALPTAETSSSGPSVSRGRLYIGTGTLEAIANLGQVALVHHLFAIAIDGL
jgi:polyvinyl alcohol dehydrogenase (cytochrome)